VGNEKGGGSGSRLLYIYIYFIYFGTKQVGKCIKDDIDNHLN
jgi:hypothetical protein